MLRLQKCSYGLHVCTVYIYTVSDYIYIYIYIYISASAHNSRLITVQSRVDGTWGDEVSIGIMSILPLAIKWVVLISMTTIIILCFD